jgi:small subunit ribosomal protein S14
LKETERMEIVRKLADKQQLEVSTDMAKKSTTLRNEKRIRMAANQYAKRQELKEKALDPKISDEERYKARMKLQSLPRNGAKERVRNRCQLSGRPRGIYKKFMISRIVFREMAHKGLIPGVTKSSW